MEHLLLMICAMTACSKLQSRLYIDIIKWLVNFAGGGHYILNTTWHI